jgi:ribosomal protein S18 acetylase RimI-like enzyme
MPHLSIRPVCRTDLPALEAVLETSGLFPPDLLPDMVGPFLDQPETKEIWLTYVRDEVPIALAYCVPERMTDGTWNLLAIAVHAAAQGAGVGGALTKHLEDLLGARGQRLLLVETSGLETYQRTRSFYSNQGYRQEACIRDFYAAGEDKIVYAKSLSR